MNDLNQVMMAMNNMLVQAIANPEALEMASRIRQNCIYAGGAHEEHDYNQRILICHQDNRPCMMQCMNGTTSIKDGIYG